MQLVKRIAFIAAPVYQAKYNGPSKLCCLPWELSAQPTALLRRIQRPQARNFYTAAELVQPRLHCLPVTEKLATGLFQTPAAKLPVDSALLDGLSNFFKYSSLCRVDDDSASHLATLLSTAFVILVNRAVKRA